MSSKNVNTQNPSNMSPFRDGVAPFRDGVSKFDSARLLYMAGDTTQKSIAATVGVSERTMHSWIKNNGWDRLRHSARTAPAIIAENMFSQIVALQNDIASREEGKRYPTMQEAELTRKLCLSIDRMKSAPALSQSMQVLRLFRTFAQSHYDTKFHLQLNQVIEHFLEGEAKNGYFPYQVEYGLNEPSETIPGKDEGHSTHSVLPAPSGSDGEGLMKESFSTATSVPTSVGKEPVRRGGRQNDEKRSLFVVQSGDNGAHSTGNIGNENQPEICTHQTPATPSKTATADTYSHPPHTSDFKTDQQKLEAKRKFSHASLNRIASQ